MKPSPCRFVLFHYYDVGVDKMRERPAVITSVIGKDGQPLSTVELINTELPEELHVNLRVFFEPNDVDRDRPGDGIDERRGDYHRSMVPAAHPDPFRTPKPHTWSWPPRIG